MNTESGSLSFSSSPLPLQANDLWNVTIAMDPIGRDLFSRGPSPPPQSLQFQAPPSSQLGDPTSSPVPSHHDVAPPPQNSHLENLLHGLNAPSSSHVSPQPSLGGSNIYNASQDPTHSGPATPASVNAGSVSSSVSAPSVPNADRQNALLSLLGAVTSPSGSVQGPPAVGTVQPMQPQQVPTPPGSTRGSTGPSNESQGKLLLEQLMSG